MARYAITDLTTETTNSTTGMREFKILEASTKGEAIKAYRDLYAANNHMTLAQCRKLVTCERVKDPKVAKVPKLTCAICRGVIERKSYVIHVREHPASA